jgi:hypothetical protein
MIPIEVLFQDLWVEMYLNLISFFAILYILFYVLKNITLRCGPRIMGTILDLSLQLTPWCELDKVPWNR